MEEQLQELINDLLKLIEDVEQSANEGDWESVKWKLAKIKKYVQTLNYEECQDRINSLEQRLLSNSTQTTTIPSNNNDVTPSNNHWLIIFSGWVIFVLLLIGLFLWRKRKKSKKF